MAFLGDLLANLTAGRRGVLTILIGTATGQLLAFVASPVLTRIYSPNDFGVFTVIGALAMILGSIASLRFELAIPLPRDDSDAYSLVALGLWCAGVAGILGTALMALIGGAIADLFDEQALAIWTWIVPIVAAPMAVYRVLNQLAVRQGRYNAIARRNVLQSTSTVLAQVGAGSLGFHIGGLVTGFAAGHAIGAASLLRDAGLTSDEGRAGRHWRSMRRALIRYRRFPMFLTPAGLLNSLGLYMPVLLLAYWYGGETAGWFGLTQRVLTLPVTLIGQAVAQVYLSEVARSRRDLTGRETTLFWQASKRLAIVGLSGALLLIVAGPFGFALVFGEPWTMSGDMARAMAIAIAAQMVASPVSQTLIVFERTAMQFGWDSARLITTAGAVAICAAFGTSALTAVWAYAAMSSLSYAASWDLSRRTLNSAHPPMSPRR